MRTMTIARARCWPGDHHLRGLGPCRCSCPTGRDGRHAAEVGPGGFGVEAFGVVAGCHDECSRGVGADAEEVEESGTVATRSASIRSSSSANSSSRALIRWASEDNDALVAAVTGSADRVGRSLSFGHESRDRQALQAATELFRGAVAEVAHLDQRLDPGLAGRALGHDQDPDGFDGAVAGLGLAARPAAQGSAGRFDGIERIGLATAAPLLSVRSVDLDDVDTHSAQVTGQPRP